MLNDLLIQILELADIITGYGHSADVMAKTISAVRDVKAFDHLCRNPPRGLQELNSALRSCALEADCEVIRATTNTSGYMAGGDDEANTFATLADDISEAFYIDRNLRTNPDSSSRRSPFRGYGQPSRRNNERRRVPWDVCIVCNKKGCHSSKHCNRSRKELKKFVKASAYVSFGRNSAAMGLPHKDTDYVVDAAIIDTACSTMSLIGDELVTAAKFASVCRTKPQLAESPAKIGGIGGKVVTTGTMMFYFMFDGQEYGVKLNIVPGGTPLILSTRTWRPWALTISPSTRLSNGQVTATWKRSK